MRKLALERLRENYKVSEEIKGKYKNELKQLEKAHLLPFSVRLKNFFSNLLIGLLVYSIPVIIFFAMGFLPQLFPEIDSFLQSLYPLDMIYYLLAGALMLFDIGFTIFGVVWIAWLIIDLFTQKDKSLKEDKIKLIDKYNDFGYYPQYESIVSEIRADKYCAYYDENLECFRCPVDDAFVGHSADTKKCIQNGYINECETCVKNKLMHTYNEVVD